MNLKTRIRALGGDPRMVVGATIGVLLVVVPLVVLAALLATGHTGDLGALALLVMLLAAGVYVCFTSLRGAGMDDGPQQVVVTDSTGLYGPTVTLPDAAPRSPWRVIAAVVALLVLGSLAFAIVMSILDDYLLGRPRVGAVVVRLLVLAVTIGVIWVVRRLIAPRSPGRARPRRGSAAARARTARAVRTPRAVRGDDG